MNCAHAKLAARHSTYRYVSACTCERGVVHIFWDAATLHLPTDALHEFSDVVTKMKPAEGARKHVWIGNVGLSLAEDDHSILSDLLRETRLFLQHASLTPVAASEQTSSERTMN